MNAYKYSAQGLSMTICINVNITSLICLLGGMKTVIQG